MTKKPSPNQLNLPLNPMDEQLKYLKLPFITYISHLQKNIFLILPGTMLIIHSYIFKLPPAILQMFVHRAGEFQ
jgi:hypothetical protein